MASAFAAFGTTCLCLAFAALHLSTFLDPQRAAGTGTATPAEAALVLLDSAGEVLAPLAAAVVLFVGVALAYRHLMSRHVVAAAAGPVAGGAGNGRRSVSALVMFMLCVSVGTLEFIVFGRGQAAAAGGGGAGHGAQARTLGLAALRAMPAVATVTFFCGVMLILAGAAHVRGGGVAGVGAAVAGDGPVQGPLRLLTKIAAGAGASLVGFMALATLTLYG